MEKRIGILHISDIHAQEKSKKKLDESFSSQFGGQPVYSDSICHTHILNLEMDNPIIRFTVKRI